MAGQVVSAVAAMKAVTKKPLLEKGTVAPRAVAEAGVPHTQEFPLFVGGLLVAAELHDLPNNDDLEKPISGYKMWSTQTGYVWVPKAEGDAMFGPADDADPLVIEAAFKQGLRVAIPDTPPVGTTTTTIAPTTTQAPGR